MSSKSKQELITEAFQYFQTGIRSAKTNLVRNYLKKLGLDYNELGLGFNSGQFHHRQNEDFKKAYETTGILTLSKAPVNKKTLTPYTVWGKEGIIFPLRDIDNNIVNLYSIRFKLALKPDEYLNNEGLYPAFPPTITKRLYIASTVVDAASLIQSKAMDNKESVMALNKGTLQPRHIEAISRITELKEIILFRSGDYSIKEQLEQQANGARIIEVNLPDGHSLNDMWLSYGRDGIINWLDEETKKLNQSETSPSKLIIQNQNRYVFKGQAAVYEVLGGVPMDYSNLKVSLAVTTPENQQKHRLKLDLYDSTDIENNINRITQKDNTINANLIEVDLLALTDELEKHRDRLFDEETRTSTDIESVKELTPAAEKQAVEFLTRPNLIERINETLENTGIVGEKSIRLPLFIIASSYKMPYTLHCLLQSESGAGKSHLINSVADCMPREDVMNLTRITSKSLYYYTDTELINKLIIIQDFDGMDDNAQFAFRELQSAGFLTSSTTDKDRYGNIKAKQKFVKAHFSSLVATTRPEVYYDNMTRSIILGVDESQEQTKSIINYQNRKISGMINQSDEEKARQLLRNCIRVLKSIEVINPFAHLIRMPLEAKMQRRLNQQLQNYIAQITIIHQYQRKRDDKGRLIATREDVIQAIDTFFPALFLKVDELDSSTRQFFERLKAYVRKQPKGTTQSFTSREIRQALNVSDTQAHRFFERLKELEYIQIVEGSVNRGFKYQIVYWDDIVKLRTKIQTELKNQIAENAVINSENGTPDPQ